MNSVACPLLLFEVWLKKRPYGKSDINNFGSFARISIRSERSRNSLVYDSCVFLAAGPGTQYCCQPFWQSYNKEKQTIPPKLPRDVVNHRVVDHLLCPTTTNHQPPITLPFTRSNFDCCVHVCLVHNAAISSQKHCRFIFKNSHLHSVWL